MTRIARSAVVASVAIVAALAFVQAASGADWPNFLGPNKDCSSPEKGINKNWRAKPPRELWNVRLGDNGYAGPAAADNKVFIIDHAGSQDVVRALDINTGREVWRFAYEDTAKDNYGYARSTPAYDGGRLYTLSCMGFLHCIDAGTGRKLWGVHLKKQLGGDAPRWRYACSPLVDGKMLVVTPGGGRGIVAVFDKTSGKLLGRGGGAATPGYATPVAATIGGRKQYVVFAAKEVLGVDAATLRRLWSVPWVTKYDVNATTPVVMRNHVFVTSNYGVGCGLVRVAGSRGQIAWKNKDMQSQFSTPIFSGGHLYGTTGTGRLVCMNPANGRVVWSAQGFEKGGSCAVDGTIIVCDGKTGDVALVEMSPARHNELGRIKPLGGQTWTAPIVAYGKLIVRNKSSMVCLDLK